MTSQWTAVSENEFGFLSDRRTEKCVGGGGLLQNVNFQGCVRKKWIHTRGTH